MSFLTTFPGNALWALLAVVFNTAKLPLWIIFYIPRSGRPHPNWSFRQAISVQIVKAFLWNAATVSDIDSWKSSSLYSRLNSRSR